MKARAEILVGDLRSHDVLRDDRHSTAEFCPERGSLIGSRMKQTAHYKTITLIAAIVFLVLAGYAAWRWTSLAEWVDVGAVYRWLRSIRSDPLAPYIVVGIYVIVSQIMFPITVLIVATAYAFGPWLGFAYAMAGSLLGALVTYAIGYGIGPETFKRIAGRRFEVLDRVLKRQGLTAAIMTHMLPVAPFTVVNLGSGVVRIRLRDFLLGSVLGMAPGTVLTTFFVHRLEQMVRNPGLPSVVLLLASAAMIGGAWWWGRRAQAPE
jgi:uncharacterized membrane protein YdjX (TVP38/TMEM64 family)